jgi:hypothetical protein
VEQFANGVVYLDRGDFRDAARAFTFVLHHRPELAAAHFNRALAHLGARRRDPGVRDLEAYLSLAPDAPDRDAVFQRIGSARATPTYSAGGVLVRWILVPGLGQYATHRPVHGAVVTLATGGALALALQTRETERTVTFVDPFGTPREYVRAHSERPYAASGVAAAVAITTLGALEAYFHSRRAANPAAGAERAAPRAVIDGDAEGVRLGVRIAIGRR